MVICGGYNFYSCFLNNLFHHSKYEFIDMVQSTSREGENFKAFHYANWEGNSGEELARVIPLYSSVCVLDLMLRSRRQYYSYPSFITYFYWYH